MKVGVMVLVGALVLGGLGGCASTSTEIQTSGLSFAYEVQGGRPIGLIRAFDDGTRTVLQFVSDPPAGLKVTDATGKVLSIERIGQHIVLPGLQGQVRVMVDSTAAPAMVRSLGDARATPQGAASSAAGAGEGNAISAARADLWFAESKMAELEARMGVRKGNKADKAQLEELKGKLNRARKTLDGSMP